MEDAAKDYAAGFAAGVATVLIGHPFDTVKGREGGEPELFSIVPAAAIGGVCISMILCPTELVKCRLQVQVSEKGGTSPRVQRYDGPLDCLRKTIKNDGVRGVFRGSFSTLLRECTGNSCFFTTYEFTRYKLLTALEYSDKMESQPAKAEPSKKLLYGTSHSKIMVEGAVDVLSGGLAGMVFWAVVLPFDVAKTRIQTAVDPSSSRNPFHNLKMIHRELGTRGLYAGLGPTLARAFPANAAAMLTWELTAKLLGVRRKEQH